jgi:hypothetical protein
VPSNSLLLGGSPRMSLARYEVRPRASR